MYTEIGIVAIIGYYSGNLNFFSLGFRSGSIITISTRIILLPIYLLFTHSPSSPHLYCTSLTVTPNYNLCYFKNNQLACLTDSWISDYPSRYALAGEAASPPRKSSAGSSPTPLRSLPSPPFRPN